MAKPNYEKIRYDVLYNQTTTIPSEGKTISLSENPAEQGYKFLIVQVFNTYQREFIVIIPCYEFSESNHHYAVVSATNSNELDILRVSPTYSSKKIQFAYDKFKLGINLRKIVGVY